MQTKNRRIVCRFGYLYDEETGHRFDKNSPTEWTDPNTGNPAPNSFHVEKGND